MAEKSEVTVKAASLEELQNFMEGSQAMDGGRYDDSARGMTSEDPLFFQPRNAETPTENSFVQSPQPQGQNWQALYGRETNEKGQWRRTAEEALQQLELAKAELAALRTGSTQTATAANYSQVTPQINPNRTQAAVIPERFFPDRDLNDAVLVEDVERMLKDMVAPEILNLREQSAALQGLQLNTAKANLGITQAVEFQLVQGNPWLNAIGDPFARLNAMQSLLAQRSQSVQQPTQQAQQPQRQVQPGNAAVRRLTMVESMTPQASEADMDATAIMRREMAEAMAQPFGEERSRAMRAVFNKYGVMNENDIGPGVLSR